MYIENDVSPVEKNDPQNNPNSPVDTNVSQTNIQDYTTKAEKLAFYLFGLGSEPYYGVVMAVCIPILLEQLSANSGYQHNRTTKCDLSKQDYQCLVKIGDWYIATESFSLFVISFSVLIQATLFIMMSSLALKKKFLLGFSFIGSITTILFITIKNDMHWVASILTVISNVAFGASYVFYYSYLNTLSENDKKVLCCKKTLTETEKSNYEFQKKRERISNKISGLGFAFGYVGVVFFLMLSIALSFAIDKTIFMQAIICIVGSWWFIFTIITMKLMKARKGKRFPKETESYFLFSIKQIYKTLKNVTKLSNAFILLLSWFMLSDGLTTIVNVAILFAKKELKMGQSKLFIIATIAPLSAAIGLFVFGKFQNIFRLSTKTMLIVLNSLYLLLPLYATIGLFTNKFGIQTEVELYIFAVYHGLLLGSIQSCYRVQFSELLPKGKESEFFGLYQITDKGSSWIGPLVVGQISNLTNNIRYGFIFLIFMFLIPLGLNIMLNVKKGVKQASEYID